MISHQIVIRAITGSTTRSGELVVFNSKTKALLLMFLKMAPAVGVEPTTNRLTVT